MDTRLLAAMARQHGLVSHREIRRLGFTLEDLRRMRRSGELVPVRRGWYTSAETWAALDEHTGARRLRAIAAGLSIRVPFVFSHESSAYLQGLPVLRPATEIVHVTQPRAIGGRTDRGVKHHIAAFRDADTVVHDGLTCLDLPRTAVDIAREHGYDLGLAAIDSARHRGVSVAQLESVVERMRFWPGVVTAREALANSRGGVESIGETLTRTLVGELGLEEEPETQFPVLTDKGVVWCDLRVGNHVFEFHGRIKLLPPDLGGVATHQMADVVTDAAERSSLIRAEGLGVSDLTWRDVWGPGRQAALRRIDREWHASERAYGTRLAPDLAAKVAHLRGRRRTPYCPA